MNARSLGFITLLSLATTFGCSPTSPPVAGTGPNLAQEKSSEVSKATQSGAVSGATATAEHGHKAGEHGGIMVSLGRDSYHIEAVFEASPQDGDAPNRTSLFIGKLPQEFVGKNLEITVPNINIAGERFRLGFTSVSVPHDASDSATGMPDKLADSAEHDLYLVSGGRYTAADILANGNSSASKKFRGIKSSHDMFPKAGDRICPITKTKANSKFTWVVDGKAYLFCCPPCVDEFVKTAKASSDPLAEPDSYVKQ